MTTREGGCLCGAVRYKVEGDPIVSGACYCRDCQYVAGGGAAYGSMYPAAAVTVTAGETRRHKVVADSGAEVFREFCPCCGVHLISYNSSHPAFKSIKAGTLDDPSGFRSEGSIWTASAQPWHRIERELPAAEGNPDPGIWQPPA